MNAGGADGMLEGKCVENVLSERVVTYLETLILHILKRSGYGTVSIRIENGRIHTVECTVSEKPPT